MTLLQNIDLKVLVTVLSLFTAIVVAITRLICSRTNNETIKLKETQIENLKNEIDLIRKERTQKAIAILDSDDLKRTSLTCDAPDLWPGPHKVFKSMSEAKAEISKECIVTKDIKILANKGIEFIGTDSSIVSTEDMSLYDNLKKIRTLLLNRESRWINEGFIRLRKHESLSEYKNNVKASHEIVSGAIVKFLKILPNTRTGLKYYLGEPVWRMIVTENFVYVSNYADPSQTQVINLPVYRYDNVQHSLYPALKRYFNQVWHNLSVYDDSINSRVDFKTSGGGIVHTNYNNKAYVLLLNRDDGNWVLPKGHKKANNESIENCAIREVSEESGIPREFLKVERFLEMYTDTTIENETKIVHIFQISYTGNDLPSLIPDNDHEEAKWFEINDEIPILYYSYQSTILAEFVEELMKH